MAQTAGAYVYHVTVTEPGCVGGVVRYVGKGRNGRSQSHLKATRRLNERRARGERVRGNKFYNRLAKALREGCTVTDEIVIAGLTCEMAFYLERLHIASFRESNSGQLWNSWSGGEGPSSEDMRHMWADPVYQQAVSAALRGRKLSPEHAAKAAAANRGKKRSPEAIAKTAAAMRGRKLSPEHVSKITEANRGREVSPETRAKQSATMRGRKLSPEHVAKIAAALRGKKLAPEHVEKLRGREYSLETRVKISAAMSGREFSPEHRAKIAAANRRRKGRASPETRAKLSAVHSGRLAKISAAQRGKKLSPEHCAKLSEAQRRRHAHKHHQPELREGVSVWKGLSEGSQFKTAPCGACLRDPSATTP